MEKQVRVSEFLGKYVSLYLSVSREEGRYQKFRGTISHGADGEMRLEGKDLRLWFWHGDFHLPLDSCDGARIKIQSVSPGAFRGGILFEGEDGKFVLLNPEGEEFSFSTKDLLAILVVKAVLEQSELEQPE